MDNSEFQAHSENIERLLQQVNSLPDEAARASALGLMQGVMDLHGAGLSRVVELLSGAGEPGRKALLKVADDPLVCGLLVLYGIHPLSLEERLALALEKVQPKVQKQGMAVDLVAADGTHVRLHFRSSTSDRHSGDGVRTVVEQVIREAAPEVEEIVIEGLTTPGFVPLSTIQSSVKLETGETI